ncbi:hypothetical protein SDC9_148379 [bioreactor metagenome]|uniref:Uncharacterized protein n=1 Tax=bioreactor metagenome TaxID=1076179 RepID=A0A645EKU0_9ZZZZ
MRQGDQKFVVADIFAAQFPVMIQLRRRAEQRQLQRAVADLLRQARGKRIHDLQRDLRILAPHFHQGIDEAAFAEHRGDGADGEMTVLTGARRVHEIGRILPPVQNLFRLRQKHPTGRGQRHFPFIGPRNQRNPQLLFQFPDAAAQRRLGDAEPGGGAGEMELLRDGDEILQLVEFHLIPQRY